MNASDMPIYAGGLHALEGVLVRGWAMDLSDIHQTVAVELVADGQPIALVSACGCDSALPSDVQGHVFRKLLPESVLRRTHRLSARVANRGLVLGSALSPSTCFAKAEPRRTAWVSNNGSLKVHGVVLERAATDTSQSRVRFRVDGEWLDWVVADRRDPDLLEAGNDDCHHAFDFTLPLRYADGCPHLVQVYARDGCELPGSPFTVLQFPRTPRAWLHSLDIAPKDREVLDALLELHEKCSPQSLDWSAYPAWKQRFGTSRAPSSAQHVLIVVGPSERWSISHKTLESIGNQSHDNWRALVWAPIGEKLPVPPDARIEFVRAGAWAKTLRSAVHTAENITSLEMGDAWQPDLLRHALWRLKEGADLTYCDADDDSGGPPWFKPDWCPDTFVQLPMLEHGMVFKAKPFKKYLSTLSPCPLDWPWQIVSVLGQHARIAHISHPLHSRGDGKAASMPRAVMNLPGRPDVAGLVAETFAVEWHPAQGDGPHPVHWTDPPSWPTVCLIVPTRDAVSMLKNCIASLQQTDYEALTICVVDNQSTEQATQEYLSKLADSGIRVLQWPYPFNFSSINNLAVASVNAEVIGLINNDVRALDAGWLKALVRQLMRPGVAAVGAKLLWPNRMVQHIGVALGLHGLAGHSGNQWRESDAGYHNLNRITRTVSAVTAACLLLRRDDYLAVGGMDDNAFPVNFNDVDLCLRLGERIGRVVVTPDAVLEHAESATRGRDETPDQRARLAREYARLSERWASVIAQDPYYNSNLNLDRYSYDSLAFPPRSRES